MKKTTKFALTAAAVVLVLGVIFGAWYVQTYYGVAPGSEGEKEPRLSEMGGLRVCVDLGHNQVRTPAAMLLLDPFRKKLAAEFGIEGVTFEIVPGGTEGDREMMLQRLRTEISAGDGPDVFILDCAEAYHSVFGYDEALFNFPEAAMGRQTFLPLDDYLSTAKYLDLDDLTRPILNAGRTEEGQVILPLAYTLPLTLYSSEDFTPPGRPMNWEEQCRSEDPLLRLAAVQTGGWYSGFFNNTFGPLADYQTGELLVTEEDLAAHLQAAVELRSEKEAALSEEGRKMAEALLAPAFTVGTGFGSENVAVCPVYSSGGVVATITSWAAVNLHTQRPAEAFAVLDLLFSEDFRAARPCTLGEMLYDQRMPIDSTGRSTYPDFQDLIDQIGTVQFHTPLDVALEELFLKTKPQINTYNSGSIFTVTEEDYPGLVHETYRTMKKLLDES